MFRSELKLISSNLVHEPKIRLDLDFNFLIWSTCLELDLNFMLLLGLIFMFNLKVKIRSETQD